MIARIVFVAAVTVFVATGCATKQTVVADTTQEDSVRRAEEAAKRAEEAARRAEVSAEKSEVIFHKGLQK